MKKLFFPGLDDMRTFASKLSASINPDFMAYGEKPVTIALVGDQYVGKSQVEEALVSGLGTNVSEDELLGSISRRSWFVDTDNNDSCQVIGVDRAQQDAWEPHESDFEKVRLMGGVNIIQHPDETDLANASVVLRISPFSRHACPENYGETKTALAGLRTLFGELANTPSDVYGTGMRTVEAHVKDERLRQCPRFMGFFGNLPGIYTRPRAPASPS